MTCASSNPKVAVLVEMSSAHGRGLIRGIVEYVNQKTQWLLHLKESGPMQTVPRWITYWTGNGIIARIETPSIARALLHKGVPLVNVAGRTSPLGVPSVDIDNKAVCELAVSHFLQRGYRNFAYCGNPQFEWSGWRQGLFSRILVVDRITCAVFQFVDSRKGRQQLEAWLKSLAKPVGLLCANDVCGHAVLEVCAEAGLHVPADIGVLGIDDDDIVCASCRPQLSSVAPDAEGIGYLAAQTLDRLMQGQVLANATLQVKPFTVRNRQSTDAAVVGDWHVSQALRFILGHATRGINVEDVVAQVHTSRRFLEKRFREIVGRPIHVEIFRIRFEYAQNLLATSALPLKDVALRSGFRKADYLSFVFRQHLGLSPSEFRKSKRGV
jgi:LacI family transcriptional regulator